MNILLIGSHFYGYENEIINEVQKKNNLDFFCTSLNIIQKIKYKFYEKIYIGSYYERKIKKYSNKKYDLILYLYDNRTNQKLIKSVKKYINYKKIYLYIWDDLNRVKNFNEIKDYFDKIYSFDKEDCKRENLKYRPTFYSERLKKLKNETEIKYKYFFIGEYRRDRYKMLNKIISREIDNNNYFYFYCSYQMVIRKYFFDFFKNKKIFTKKISKEKYNELFSKSNIIIDIPEKNQKGLTQRILDGIFLEKKIITTNEDIKFEKFYNPNNILVVKNFEKIDKNFLEKPYVKIENEIVEYYSVNSWVKEVLEGVE